MKDEHLKLIVARLADESRRNRTSAVAFLGIAVLLQVLLFVGLRPSTSKDVPGFLFLSLICAGIPFVVGIFYLRQMRRNAARENNLLWRALTTEPRLITTIYLEIPRQETPEQRKAEIADRKRQNLVGNIFDGVFNTNSTPDFTIDLTSGVELKPRVIVRLTDGDNREVPAAFESHETIAVLRRHAPHAAVVESDYFHIHQRQEIGQQ